MSDDHNGLDIEVKYSLINGLTEYRKKKNIPKSLPKIVIGVLSLSSNRVIPTYSSVDEIQCFDFYCDYENKIYINGKLL
jgi:hypothetical protein